ncbi:MarR family transcriptional regulator [Lysinibacillus sp. 2017]|uniref:MarR family winged helix-turn-helix transcriptional regulator n=1 Tax=unclassified Lysinibacillus TaxID=2636778 RepID=UPI000D5259FA|nr:MULTISPECIES: MarR family transcriptional regulator [unclassified Lysinibacillus]AWE07218.1 MarR family transcriptional regulator [Lysinibacillus sp. 2017]TGN34675.1 MarR family transcriptional regulator [Lysinibacillus sp. S2017]
MDKEIKSLNQYWTDIYFALHYVHEEQISHQAVRILQLIKKTNLNSVGNIAEYLKISHNTASEHVKRLVNRGYLSKSRSTEDERRVILYLTKLGEDVLEKNTSLDESKLEKIMQSLSDQERLELVNSLKLLSERAK